MNKTCQALNAVASLRNNTEPFVVMLKGDQVPFFVYTGGVRSMEDDGFLSLAQAYLSHMAAGRLSHTSVFYSPEKDHQPLSYKETADKLLDIIQTKASTLKEDVDEKGWASAFLEGGNQIKARDRGSLAPTAFHRYEFTVEGGQKVELLLAKAPGVFWMVNGHQLHRGSLAPEFTAAAIRAISKLDESEITDDHVFIYKALLEDAQATGHLDQFPHYQQMFNSPPAGFGFYASQPFTGGRGQKLSRAEVDELRAFRDGPNMYRIEPRWEVLGEAPKPWRGPFAPSPTLKEFFDDLLKPVSPPEKKDE